MRKLLAVTANLAIIAVIVVGGFLIIQGHRQILDWWVLRDYQPPARISQLADQAAMTDPGRRLFYRSMPEINADRESLASNCRIDDPRTIELGCYLSTDKIYLLDIQQPELASEMVVTAAHEMLHAAYERLDRKQKVQLAGQLRQAASGLNDARLQKRLAEYGNLEAGEEDNELHSILATEYANLTPELEKHYAKYLANRALIVTYSDEFNRTFDGLREEIDALSRQIQVTRDQMERYKVGGQVELYNSLVPGINRQITLYNQKVDRYNRYSSVLLGQPPAKLQQ